MIVSPRPPFSSVIHRFWTGLAATLILASAAAAGGRPPNHLPNPVMFVTQAPIPEDFATIGSPFANHLAELVRVGRGGDLYILYPDGTLKNVTRAAGYGSAGFQGDTAIAVRDPEVHWAGQRAIFSMVVGAAGERYEQKSYYWQLYEVTGLGRDDVPVITKVPFQPAEYNNVEPTYAGDGRILFASDRPRNGARHLYPQLDEYEGVPSTTGLWSLDPSSGELFLMNHAPSGAFAPMVDSFGRVVFTRWDHLQRDQLRDEEVLHGALHGPFDWASEAVDALSGPPSEGSFPEPRPPRTDLLPPWVEGLEFNQFLPWQIEQDGSGEEVLNHLGRHELYDYFNRSRNDDPDIEEFIASRTGRANPYDLRVMLHIREDPTLAGNYIGTSAPVFGTHSSGQLVALWAPPTLNPDSVVVEHLTHPSTSTVVADEATAPPDHSGHYRDPLPLSDGSLLAIHASEVRAARNEGSRALPEPRYHFRLVRLVPAVNGYLTAGPSLTGGIQTGLSYWDPDVSVSYDGPLWELSPVEVRTKPLPSDRSPSIPPVEREVFSQENVDIDEFREWLRDRALALLVVRDATSRDAADRQQPFNLRVPGGTQTVGGDGTVYEISHLQIYQADQVRGYTSRQGRRSLPRSLHEPEAVESNPKTAESPGGNVVIAPDGSIAGFVPARRALSWHLRAPSGESIVKERYWLTFQPGEVRVCDGCHGVNVANQAGQAASSQMPDALRSLLRHWQASIFSDGFEGGNTSRWQ